MLELLAKSKSKETIREHTDLVLKDFSDILIMYGEYFTDSEKEMIRCSCEYHDYGKSIYGFQKVVGNSDIFNSLTKEDIEKIKEFYKKNNLNYFPHGYISPTFLQLKELKEKLDIECIKIIVNAIFNHHVRDMQDLNLINEIIENDLKKRFPDKKFNYKYKQYIFSKENLEDDIWVKYAVVIGILNKCDYHASSHSSVEIEISPYKDGKSIAEIVESKLPSLRSVQAFMKENKESSLVVIASTGIGKTEAALLWADKCKTFYTLPLRVSINAIYQRVKDNYNYGVDKISLLHSDALSFLLENNEEKENAILKDEITRKLSYPLTVCTVDQLFTFVYKYRGSEILLATLKYSKLIIDEIQAYSPDLVAKIICGLKLITMCGGKFAIITATMPPVFEYFMRIENIQYKNAEKPFLSIQKSRHFISFQENEFDIDKIKADGINKKVLVICNTVSKAQELFEKIGSARLLHSKFIKKHRKMLEDKILEFTNENNNENGIWISTQIVEASLDIDFDVLYTEMSTADSLLQRLGRCYRRREYDNDKPNVYIYNTGNGIGKVYNKEIYERSIKYILDYNNQIFNEEDKMSYVNKVYEIEELKNTEYFKNLKSELLKCKNIIPGIFNKEEAKKQFRDITSYTVIPLKIYNEETNKIDEAMECIMNSNNRIDKISKKEFINSLTLSVSKINNDDYYQMGDIKNLKIHIAGLVYDFDEENCFGAGLTKEKYIQNVM